MRRGLAWLSLLAASTACSGANDSSAGGGFYGAGGSYAAGGVPGAGGQPSSGGSFSTGGVPSLNPPGGAGGALTSGPVVATGGTSSEECAGVVTRGESLPLDVFVMWDRSASMDDPVKGGTKWELVTAAFGAFLADPRAAGLGLGVGVFPLGAAPGEITDYNTTCEASRYASPGVEIAPLPGNAGPVLEAIGSVQRDGRTPTRVALQGALDHARVWATAHPASRTIVVLQTDGEPNVCDSSIDSVAAVAAEAVASTPSIPTYVVGVGSKLGNLDAIARAGGTSSALIIDTDGDTTAQFVAAMNGIQNAASVSCDYILPPPPDGRSFDTNALNVTVATTRGTDTLPNVGVVTACDPAAGGWYYDDPLAPARVKLCPVTCSAVGADRSATVSLVLRCRTAIR